LEQEDINSINRFRINPKQETVKSCAAIDQLVSNDNLKDSLQNALRPLDAQLFNYIFFRCEKEEQVEMGQGCYDVANFGKFVYCGLKGVEPVIRRIQETNDLGHPVCGNLREGVWLASYIVGRLRRVPELNKIAELLEESFRPLNDIPHFLRPCYFELAFSYIYTAMEEILLQKIG
jgi:glycogen debranching enzyme